MGPTATPLLLADTDGKPEVTAELEFTGETATFVGPAIGIDELKLAELIIADAMEEVVMFAEAVMPAEATEEIVLFAEALMPAEATLEGEPVPSGNE